MLLRTWSSRSARPLAVGRPMVRPLWRMAWWFLITLNTFLPYDAQCHPWYLPKWVATLHSYNNPPDREIALLLEQTRRRTSAYFFEQVGWELSFWVMLQPLRLINCQPCSPGNREICKSHRVLEWSRRSATEGKTSFPQILKDMKDYFWKRDVLGFKTSPDGWSALMTILLQGNRCSKKKSSVMMTTWNVRVLNLLFLLRMKLRCLKWHTIAKTRKQENSGSLLAVSATKCPDVL